MTIKLEKILLVDDSLTEKLNKVFPYGGYCIEEKDIRNILNVMKENNIQHFNIDKVDYDGITIHSAYRFETDDEMELRYENEKKKEEREKKRRLKEYKYALKVVEKYKKEFENNPHVF